MKVTFSALPSASKTALASLCRDTLVLPVGDDKKLSSLGQALDAASGKTLSKAMASSKFEGKKGQCLSILAPAGLSCQRVVLAGIGAAKSLTETLCEQIGGAVAAHLDQAGTKDAVLLLEAFKHRNITPAHMAARIGFGAVLRHYRFFKYRTKMKADEKPSLASLSVLVDQPKKAAADYATLEKLADAVCFTRDIVSEPANVIHPESLAERCKDLKKLGVQVEILGEEEMHALGMHALLGVGQGSNKESQLVVLRWNGQPSDKKGPLAFVGKGVCFDTGGISIKPAGGMEEMKWDMAGAGVVIGLMKALAARKAKVNAVGVVGLVENMPDGNAQRPGDVVTSLSGQTIEVINTDAEGRLVLADALWYTQKRFKPRFMIDLATLTGAIIVALGSSRAGLFSNNDALAGQLHDTGQKVAEDLWRLPLGEVYDKQINSPIADMQNVGEGREAGSITAAQFLQRFVNDVPWAHLDIAGVAWAKKDGDITPKGASAFGVRLLNQLVADYYE